MRKRCNFTNNENRGLIDLTSVGATGPSERKHKMKPPNVSSRLDYSYEDQVDSNASISLLGDSADYDAQVSVGNAQRYQPQDPEGELVNDIQMADRIGISPKGQGFTGFVEETYYPASGKVTSKKLI